jgi:hypothetical protein
VPQVKARIRVNGANYFLTNKTFCTREVKLNGGACKQAQELRLIPLKGFYFQKQNTKRFLLGVLCTRSKAHSGGISGKNKTKGLTFKDLPIKLMKKLKGGRE